MVYFRSFQKIWQWLPGKLDLQTHKQRAQSSLKFETTWQYYSVIFQDCFMISRMNQRRAPAAAPYSPRPSRMNWRRPKGDRTVSADVAPQASPPPSPQSYPLRKRYLFVYCGILITRRVTVIDNRQEKFLPPRPPQPPLFPIFLDMSLTISSTASASLLAGYYFNPREIFTLIYY